MKKIIFILFITTLFFSCKTDKSQKLTPIKIASGGHLVHFLPLDVAMKLGLFEKYGLNPEIVYLRGGTATAQALISKQVDFSTNSVDHALKAAVQGKKDLRLIALLNQTPGVSLVIKKSLADQVKEISDLKGLNLGVTSKGSASHMILAYLMAKNGIDSKDYNVVKAGASTFAAAIEGGEIDGGISLEPFISQMIKNESIVEMVKMFTREEVRQVFGGDYVLSGILTRLDVINNKSDLVKKMTLIIKESLQYINKTPTDKLISILDAEITGSNIEEYEFTLNRLNGFYPQNGVIDSTGIINVYRSMVAAGVLDSTKINTPLQFIDNSFILSPIGEPINQN